MKRSKADILREYGPFPDIDQVHGVGFDGAHVWLAAGDRLTALDPASGKTLRSINVAAHAGTAFDGAHLFQIAESRIQKVDPKTGRVLSSIPAPGGGGDSGLAWAEGTLWVGQYRERKIHQVDPETGAILRTIQSNRFVTGVTWVDGELWHGTWEGDESDLRQNRSQDRRGAGANRDAARHARIGGRIRRPRHLLLRRQQHWQIARGETADANVLVDNGFAEPCYTSLVFGALAVFSARFESDFHFRVTVRLCARRSASIIPGPSGGQAGWSLRR